LALQLPEICKRLQESNPHLTIDLELRFGESALLWNSTSQPGSKGDGIGSVLHLPANVEVNSKLTGREST